MPTSKDNSYASKLAGKISKSRTNSPAASPALTKKFGASGGASDKFGSKTTSSNNTLSAGKIEKRHSFTYGRSPQASKCRDDDTKSSKASSSWKTGGSSNNLSVSAHSSKLSSSPGKQTPHLSSYCSKPSTSASVTLRAPGHDSTDHTRTSSNHLHVGAAVGLASGSTMRNKPGPTASPLRPKSASGLISSENTTTHHHTTIKPPSSNSLRPNAANLPKLQLNGNNNHDSSWNLKSPNSMKRNSGWGHDGFDSHHAPHSPNMSSTHAPRSPGMIRNAHADQKQNHLLRTKKYERYSYDPEVRMNKKYDHYHDAAISQSKQAHKMKQMIKSPHTGADVKPKSAKPPVSPSVLKKTKKKLEYLPPKDRHTSKKEYQLDSDSSDDEYDVKFSSNKPSTWDLDASKQDLSKNSSFSGLSGFLSVLPGTRH